LNVKRRHLSVGQQAMLALQVIDAYEAEGRERMAGGGAKAAPGRPSEEKGVADLPHLSKRAPLARDRAANVVGVSGRAVAQAKRVAEQAPDLADKVRAGELALDKAEKTIRQKVAAERRALEAKAQTEHIAQGTKVDVREGGFMDSLSDLRNIDAIITDPPYPKEFLPLLDDLAEWSDRVLAPDGVLVVLFGQTYLPEVYERLSKGRPYRWTGCYLTPGAGYVSHARRVQTNWKPVLIYGGGDRFMDVFKSDGNDLHAKSLHHWGQDYGAFHDIVERITKPGQTVVDPFMGSGTTLLAARDLGRHAIGCDIDPEHVKVARERLGLA
jgi:SAM-dependent methyltransferase